MANAQNIKIGHANVIWKGVDLGHTMGGITVSYEPEYTDIKANDFSGVIDKVLTAEKWTITVPLAESTLANITKAIGTASATSATLSKVGSKTGKRLNAVAGELFLNPTDGSEDVVFYKAVPVESVELNYEIDNERIVEVTFEALVDESKTDGNLLGHIGAIS
jgi:hypothetical protein